MYLWLIDEVKFFIMVCHEEVEHEIDCEQHVKEQAHDHPREVVCLGKGESRGRNDADDEQHNNYN